MNSHTSETDEPTQVFGLTRAELWPIVEAAAECSVRSFDISTEHEPPQPPGFQAEKAIPTFSYVTTAGDTGRVTTFVKRFYRTGPAESKQYEFLTRHAAPIPRKYGVLTDSTDHEILFIEHLEVVTPIGTMLEMLGLIARFNAVQPDANYRQWLEQVSWRFTERLENIAPDLQSLEEHALDGELGDELLSICSDKGRWASLVRTAERLVEQWRNMPPGLIHTDFSRENTGRRRPGELVAMDVEWTCLGPRFLDVAGWIARPRHRWDPDELVRERAQHYLDEYARYGGTPPTVGAFLDEMPTLWLLGEVRYVGWHVRRALGGWATAPAHEDERRSCREHLVRLLELVLQEQ